MVHLIVAYNILEVSTVTGQDQYAQAPAAGDSVKAHTKAEYGYDALGRRVWKQVEIDGQAPELTVFTWDGDLLQSETRFEGDIHQPVRSRPPGLIPETPRRKFPRPIAQQVHTLDASALVPTHTATYLYEPDSFIPLAQLTAGFDHTALAATGTDRQPLRCYQAQTATLYYFQTDHLGTPQDITDTEGRIVWSGQYRAWGQLAQAHNGQGEKAHIHNPFRFQGQYHDRETGLHYNRFRYYDPRIGRFTTQDPIGLMGGENLYQYAPNPTGWIDPLGLSKQCCGGGRVEKDGITGRFTPIDDASGPHSVYRRHGGTKEITHYIEYDKPTHPKDPRKRVEQKRYDGGESPSHFNKVTKQTVETPHVHESGTPGGGLDLQIQMRYPRDHNYVIN
ncbi:hypothetical protein BFW38_16980 [Terasakiispira papahanaumokuakeensis]|uniref:RHS protein conserved region domain-containing protein n=2 Tax=Terasakiispira papahanaumokuakeensis TaxID=197479 RepID=A0A1E2VDS3_9GAMM|nr:hypothetical protein BFW38_16980 [Terasakiispira papahanaumokuakeensis]